MNDAQVARIDRLERDLEGVGEAIKDIRDAVVEIKGLAVHAEQHSEGLKRAFAEIKELREDHGRWIETLQTDHENRIKAIEVEQPLTKISRNLVYLFMVGFVGLGLLEAAQILFHWSGH